MDSSSAISMGIARAWNMQMDAPTVYYRLHGCEYNSMNADCFDSTESYCIQWKRHVLQLDLGQRAVNVIRFWSSHYPHNTQYYPHEITPPEAKKDEGVSKLVNLTTCSQSSKHDWILFLYSYAMFASNYVLPFILRLKSSEISPCPVSLSGACSDSPGNGNSRRFTVPFALLTSSVAVNCKARRLAAVTRSRTHHNFSLLIGLSS